MPPPYELGQVERIVRSSNRRPTAYPPARGALGHPLDLHERLSNADLVQRYARELARRDAQQRDDRHEAMFFTAFVRTLDVFQYTMAAINSPPGHDAYALMFRASNSHDGMRAEITHNVLGPRGDGLEFPIRYALGTTGANPAYARAVRVVLDRVPERWERLHVHTVFPLLDGSADGCVVRDRTGRVVQFMDAELQQRRLVLEHAPP